MVTAYHMRVSALQDSCMRFYIPCFSAATEKNNFNSNILLRKILVILVFKKLNMNKKKKTDQYHLSRENGFNVTLTDTTTEKPQPTNKLSSSNSLDHTLHTLYNYHLDPTDQTMKRVHLLVAERALVLWPQLNPSILT